MLQQKKDLFKESAKMELCLQRLRSYLTTEQTAKFLLIMEKYKSKKELNLFKLWGIKKISNSHGPPVRAYDRLALDPEADLSEGSEEEGLPESGDEEDDMMRQQHQRRHGQQ